MLHSLKQHNVQSSRHSEFLGQKNCCFVTKAIRSRQNSFNSSKLFSLKKKQSLLLNLVCWLSNYFVDFFPIKSVETHPDISLLKYFHPFKILSDRRCLVSQAGKPILKIAEKDEGGTRSQVKVRELRNILIQNIIFFQWLY